MGRTLLLCFIHGFKGDDDTFKTFPQDLKIQVAKKIPEQNVESIVYPKYDTKGELGQSTELFLTWLRERVMEVRKEHVEKPWPPSDRDVGVVLIAHSMGGFVAADSLFSVLNERMSNDEDDKSPLFPLIQGILTFDTPFNGLARSMFVYGAFSNYQKVSSVFNVMTAFSAAAPANIGKLISSRSASRAVTASAPAGRSSSPAWKTWQLVAVRTGTVGAIAAGGVAAYIHREQIMEGMRNMRNMNRESVKEGVKGGYQQSVDAVGQGLAYINRGNVGKSFEYLSDHFTFVGSLMKQQELSRRLERMGALRGVGIHDFYTSLGENGVWSGGYFIPERTFCAIPTKDHVADHLFSRQVIKNVEDEIQAHMSMFNREQNDNYDTMTDEASDLVIKWFNEESDIVDDPKFAAPPPPEPIEAPIATTEDGKEVPQAKELSEKPTEIKEEDDELPDESPLDIAAAASMVPLPDDNSEAPGGIETQDAHKSTYMRYLFGIAQQTGSGIKSYVPTTIPDMPQLPSGPSFKSYIPNQMPSMPQMPNLPTMGIFSKKQQTEPVATEASTGAAETEITGESGTQQNPSSEVPGDVKQES